MQVGDLVLAASDGLFDNLYEEDIERIINDIISQEGLNLSKILKTLLEDSEVKSKDPTYESPFAKNAKLNGIMFQGGKDDDTSIILAEIVPRQAASREPNATEEL